MDLIEKAFDFTLLKLAKIYVQANKSKEYFSWQEIITDFNKQNNFDQAKLNLFPFLITIGNGHKEQLLEIFGKDFIYTSTGIFNIKFFLVSRQMVTKNLKFQFAEDSMTFETNPTSQISSLNSEGLIREISDGNSEISTILTYIDKSIDSIEEKYHGSFVSGTNLDLLHLNRMHTSFVKLENAIRLLKTGNPNSSDFVNKIRVLQDGFNHKIKFERSSLEFA